MASIPLNFTVREERAGDAGGIDQVTTDAFHNHPHSQQSEGAIIAALRETGALELSLVAEREGQIVGHVAFSRVAISDGTPDWWGLGPLSVAPGWQRRGIGRALVARGLEELCTRGASGCVVLGDAGYYALLGFAPYTQLTLPGVPPEHFLAYPFREPVPRGEVAYHAGFDVASP